MTMRLMHRRGGLQNPSRIADRLRRSHHHYRVREFSALEKYGSVKNGENADEARTRARARTRASEDGQRMLRAGQVAEEAMTTFRSFSGSNTSWDHGKQFTFARSVREHRARPSLLTPLVHVSTSLVGCTASNMGPKALETVRTALADASAELFNDQLRELHESQASRVPNTQDSFQSKDQTHETIDKDDDDDDGVQTIVAGEQLDQSSRSHGRNQDQADGRSQDQEDDRNVEAENLRTLIRKSRDADFFSSSQEPLSASFSSTRNSATKPETETEPDTETETVKNELYSSAYTVLKNSFRVVLRVAARV